jgi:hypothetical protein
MVAKVQAEVAANPPLHEGEPVPVSLHAAVLSPLTDGMLSPDEAMDACQARLDVARETGAAVLPAPPASAPAPVPAPVVPAAAEAAAPFAPEPQVETPAAPPVAGAPPSVDAALELLQAGRVQELAPQLPALIGRILPLLRLLGPKQRAQLLQFLQK